MIAIILAGGKGTRLAPFIQNTPKALIKIGEKPVIEHQILFLRENGIKEIWILLGYLGEEIKRYLQNRRKSDVRIHYCQEEKPLGTAGALKVLEGKIKEDFLVLSGDVMMDFDVKRFIRWHKQKKGIASIVVHPNDHPFDSDLVETDNRGQIAALLRRPHSKRIIFRNLSIASVYIFSPKIFKYILKNEQILSASRNKKSDFEKNTLPLLLKSKEKIYAYNTPEYLKDIGAPDRLARVRADYASRKIKKLNLKNKRRAIFLDKDGVINEEVDQLSRLEDFKIYDFASEAVKKINETDYLTIIITNQPMIAKGFLAESDLNEMHKKLETELGLKGAKIDAIYYCPHHPEKGFTGERQELKIECSCRKPEIGLLLKAKKIFNIDFEKSYFIGDKMSDILTGKKAGCKTILVKTGYGGKDGLFSVKSDFTADNLLEAVKIALLEKI